MTVIYCNVSRQLYSLQKWDAPQLEIGQDAFEHEDYDVYMARIDSIGYDATGRLNVAEDESHCPPDISWTIMKFNELLGWL